MVVYGFDGEVQDWTWLVETFGPIQLTQSGVGHVVALRAIEGPASLTYHVESALGAPLEGIPVVRHWPGAPILDPEFWGCGKDKGIVGFTNSGGDVGFGMGPGDYYFPPDIGPGCAWLPIPGGSDCVCGYGMLGGTNHKHLDTDLIAPDVLGLAMLEAKKESQSSLVVVYWVAPFVVLTVVIAVLVVRRGRSRS